MTKLDTKSKLPGFTRHDVDVGGMVLSVHVAGSGPALLLLHGYPQNHMCWLNIAPHFAEKFTCIVPDLRGYGDSDAPKDTSVDHATYSKRQMAQDMVGVLDHFGHDRAHVLGHDRGGRVAYRFALDHAERLDRLGIIEIVPTGDFWQAWNAELAYKAYHWTFLAQPYPLPENMINADPEAYVDHTLKSWVNAKSLDIFPEPALESYRAQARNPARIHAMCADYRAGATFDRKLDDSDKALGRKIAAPLRFLWAEGGFPGQTGNPEDLWSSWADQVSSQSCISGHFVMEENPEAVLDCFWAFFGSE
ncbi:haloacetate dehalogenase [Litoreibacter halocynthiae]|uniref:Haloacetate dehalogenase n=1 Tax=Litoreibacter halocynthiae TaxID=1242689 RepID=A0A4R7LGC7_9RHOB|nr:alpha/beta hydrolase [Litoreibacter halocynthiae]TDT73010.1 haloacetate dehalogenase [Litoreibacter halocynthiae]